MGRPHLTDHRPWLGRRPGLARWRLGGRRSTSAAADRRRTARPARPGDGLAARVWSVVTDPAGGTAVVALVPRNRCSAPLVDRPAPTWGTVTVVDPDGPTLDRLAGLVRSGEAVVVARTAAGLCLHADGGRLHVAIAVPPSPLA